MRHWSKLHLTSWTSELKCWTNKTVAPSKRPNNCTKVSSKHKKMPLPSWYNRETQFTMSWTLVSSCRRQFTTSLLASAKRTETRSLQSKTTHSSGRSITTLNSSKLRTLMSLSISLWTSHSCDLLPFSKWICSLLWINGSRLMKTLSALTLKSNSQKNWARRTKKCGKRRKSWRILNVYLDWLKARDFLKHFRRSFY